ncbi:MAG TPA: PhzF family phenazine biosynthesis protein [candidate division WOR-3 bacterium]|uniref:PhzF family phenazine biosynthesis protein n=1 Tax=candidate division WOR-3 bacterium TaxID=2052148 RepID=A0A9C9EKC3_UNCW3|nr:PhzF family phenazine biosynthesis protein [candidate division WOR-3 bacterium]
MKWLTTRRISTFTDKPYAGNPAWVVTGADKTESEKKLIKLASELNPLSDTVFVFPEKEGVDVSLRFFSQLEEISFSGHGTIAAYLGVEGESFFKLTEPITLVRQKTKAGVQHIELRVKEKKIQRVTVSLPQPQFISVPLDIKQIARSLSIPPVNIIDSKFPLGVVALSGSTDIIVPVDNCDTLLNITPNFPLMKSYCDRFHMTGVVVYCFETMEKDNTAHMRHFAPAVGINEDPVSGAASAGLGCYFIQNRIVPIEETTRIIIEQGYAMQRPGKVYVHVHTLKNQIMKVTFGGQGIVTFEGRTMLPDE